MANPTSIVKKNAAESAQLRQRISSSIHIQGARENNLKNLSLSIPKNKLIVITGPSGSGKSTLAFDTIFAEGQRRYIESLSAYARQFVEQLKKPEVDSITGLCPSIAIQQKTISKNPRSTVGTITEIYDFMRVLFSRVGDAFCPKCDSPIASQSLSQIADQILHFQEGTKINILAVIAQRKKGEFAKEINQLIRQGHVRARIDGRDYQIELGQKLDKSKPHDFYVYLDRLAIKASARDRILQAVETAAQIGEGRILVERFEEGDSVLFSQSLSCAKCGFSLPEMTPRLFSFNSPIGACTSCRGLGSLSSEEELESAEDEIDEEEFTHDTQTCPDCRGARLKPESLSVFIQETNISTISKMSVQKALTFFKGLEFTGNRKIISEKILHEIVERLRFLDQVGLDYLSLDRLAASLSGGEEQRVRLATQMGVQLTGVLYILDEPSIGLHQVDNQKLIESLKKLRDQGNTVIVVEHDVDTMLASDWLIDLGPGAGRHGGSIVEAGEPGALSQGITAKFLQGTARIDRPQKGSEGSGKSLWIRGANLHNLKNVDVEIPLGKFVAVSGVSGSGKSSLIMDVLATSIHDGKAYHCKKIEGLQHIEKMIRVTQSPIGRSPRSNPSTYVGIFSSIRELFAQTPVARQRGYSISRFSFNTKGGRCEECQGAGVKKIEMHFLPNVSVTCDRCYGRRYNSQTLEVLFKGKNIFEVLDMSFEEALGFFENISFLHRKMKSFCDVGLGYLKLGQPATTLSGGEAQRVKLVKELVKTHSGQSLYILDEPTTGLHLVDIRQLIRVCQELVKLGNTVVVIEHQLDVIKVADHVIDLGPAGGEGGGVIVAQGSPEEVAKNSKSATGRFLKQVLAA
jgi:excinuclease ABC subunit A